jgi:GTPase SAR1 family protein
MTDGNTRAGFVAVVGAPNAGKSTLVNALVGQKVAIVSAKAQTTRARLMGIAIEGGSQILLVDRRKRLLLEAVDLVHGAPRKSHRQWLFGRFLSERERR